MHMKRILAFAAALTLLTINAFAQEDEGNALLGHSFTAASGITWAQCNLGASEPQEFGDYYKWTELSAAPVAAPWRIPTFDEWGELARKYKWEKIKDGDVTLWHVFDNKGNDLYLPVAGAMEGGKHRKFPFEYWTNAKYDGTPARADAAWVDDGQMMMAESMSTGLPVRMVKGEIVHATDVKVPASVDITVGQYTRVGYTVLPEDAGIKLVRFWSDSPAVNVSEDGVVTGVRRGQYTIHADLFTATGYKTKDIRVTVKPGVTEFTCNASSVTALNATISGKFKIDSPQGNVLSKDIYILYSSEVSGADKLIAEGISVKLDMDKEGNYKSRLHGLKPSTRYNFIIYAYVQGGAKYYSGQESFTTKDLTAAAIDLGLPSGTKWAGINLSLDQKKVFEWCDHAPAYRKANETCLFTPNDKAWLVLGKSWRIPSTDEFSELFANCDLYTYSNSDVELVSKINGNSIIIPQGSYWTSNRPAIDDDSLDNGTACCMSVSEDGILAYQALRFKRLGIRPVWRKVTDNYPTNMTVVDNNAVKLLKPGDSFNIEYSIEPQDADMEYIRWYSCDETVAKATAGGLITAVNMGITEVRCFVNTVEGPKEFVINVEVYNPDDYVDMGLSVLWAKNNIGGYWNWGDRGESGHHSSKQDYLFWDGNWNHLHKGLNKYCNNLNFGYQGQYGNNYTDDRTRLEPMDDMGHYGHIGPFRTPTREEWKELADPANCRWESYTINGTKGVKITSIKTGNSIFLPVTGYMLNEKSYGENAIGRYWTADLYEPNCNKAWTIEIDPKNNGGILGNVDPKEIHEYRWAAQAVRPVLDLK